MKILENYSLTQHNTFKLNASCDRFVELTNEQDIFDLLSLKGFDKNHFFILGEGSNVILPEHYSGTVIKPAFYGFQNLSGTSGSNSIHKSETFIDAEISAKTEILKVGSGESWSSLIDYCLGNDLPGLENLTLIPGSVGAAPVQNIGAYGVEVCELIDSVEVFNFTTSQKEVLSNEACQFAYRDSIFKKNPSVYMLISVNFIFNKSRSLNAEYGSLATLIENKGLSKEDLSSRDLSELVASIRQERLPDPLLLPNVGSFFKNPIVSKKIFEQLYAKFPELVSFPYGENLFKLSAAWLIEYCGWKGKGDGDLSVSDKHSLVLINQNNHGQVLTRAMVLSFAGKIQQDVKKTFSVDLEIEPVLK